MPSLNTKLATAPNVSANYVLKATTSTTIGNSLIYDDGTNVGIGTSSPSKKLEIVSNTSQDGIKISGSSNPRLTIIDTTNSVQFDALTTDTEAVLRTDTNHPLLLSTNGTERMRITAAGNVGIGTSSPDRLLQISNTSGQAVFSVIAATNDSADIFFGDTNNTAEAVIRFVNGTNSLNFLNGGSTRMTITNGGAVQLPKGQLEFTGTNGGVELGTTVGIIKYDNSNVAFYYGTGDLIFKVNSNQVGDIVFFKQDGTIRFAKYTSNGTLTTTSSNGTIAVSSDKNMKIDAGYVENGLDKVMSLKPRYFYWKDEEKFGNKKQLGFYAQEVNEVSEEASNTPEEGQGWGIYDRALIAILTKAVQELNQQVQHQQQTINSLINR